MAEQSFRFENGANYERYMGIWSQSAGEIFLHWLVPKSGLRWLDVGCGNGAFTEIIVDRCAPAEVQGIDPSEGQLAFARTRPASGVARFRQGDAMALPFPDYSFDVAVMPLVIFFVPDPVKGVAEMVRVVCPGGVVSAYSWDMVGGGFPYEVLHDEMRSMNVLPATVPSIDASRIEVMTELWNQAGLKPETRGIEAHRTFSDFDEYWTTVLGAPSAGAKLAAMDPLDLETLKDRVQALITIESSGRITCSARANAIKGRVSDR